MEQCIQRRTLKRAIQNVDVQNTTLKCIQQRTYDDNKLDKLKFLKYIAPNIIKLNKYIYYLLNALL